VVTISTTERIREHLERLVATGMFGKNPAEAAERLVSKGIQEILLDRTLEEQGLGRGPKSKRR
jgi:hypothetical protein